MNLYQVDGCGEELVNAKAYYKRYRICPEHCNMECLVIEGQRLRFCQQCGSFHDLRDFEGRRKSCKRKLTQHNERRRKAKDDRMSQEIQVAEQHIKDPEVMIFEKLRNNSRSKKSEAMHSDHVMHDTSASIGKPANLSRPEEQSLLENDEVFGALAVERKRNGNDSFDTQTKAMSVEGNAVSKDMRSGLSLPKVAASSRSIPETSRDIGGKKQADWKADSTPTLVQPLGFDQGGTATSHASVLQNGQQQFAGGVPWASNTLTAASNFLVAREGPLVGYNSNEEMIRLSLKLFECYPDELLPIIREELNEMLRTGPATIEGYLRPGCVHLTVDVRLPKATPATSQQLNAVEAVNSIMRNKYLRAINVSEMALQYKNHLIVATRDQFLAHLSVSDSSDELVPHIEAIVPLALCPLNGKANVTLVCPKNSINQESLILCRQAGRYRVVEIPLPPEANGNNQGEGYPPQEVSCTSMETQIGILGLSPGWAEIEIQQGLVLSRPRPCLVCRDALVVAEIRQLEGNTKNIQRKEIHSVDDFVRDLGMILVYLHREETERQGLPTPMYTSKLLESIQTAACGIVVCAVARGWFSTVKLVLPATMAVDHSKEAAMKRMNDHCAHAQGGNLLHVAIGTGNPEIVRVLGEWSCFEKGSSWSILEKAPVGGISPLHVAAMLPLEAGQRMIRELSKLCPRLEELWANTFSDDGVTPQQLWSIVHLCNGGSPEPHQLTVAETSAAEGMNKTRENLKGSHRSFDDVYTTYLLENIAVDKVKNGGAVDLDRDLAVKILQERKMNDLCSEVDKIGEMPRSQVLRWTSMWLVETVTCLVIVSLAALILH